MHALVIALGVFLVSASAFVAPIAPLVTVTAGLASTAVAGVKLEKSLAGHKKVKRRPLR